MAFSPVIYYAAVKQYTNYRADDPFGPIGPFKVSTFGGNPKNACKSRNADGKRNFSK